MKRKKLFGQPNKKTYALGVSYSFLYRVHSVQFCVVKFPVSAYKFTVYRLSMWIGKLRKTMVRIHMFLTTHVAVNRIEEERRCVGFYDKRYVLDSMRNTGYSTYYYICFVYFDIFKFYIPQHTNICVPDDVMFVIGEQRKIVDIKVD